VQIVAILYQIVVADTSDKKWLNAFNRKRVFCKNVIKPYIFYVVLIPL